MAIKSVKSSFTLKTFTAIALLVIALAIGSIPYVYVRDQNIREVEQNRVQAIIQTQNDIISSYMEPIFDSNNPGAYRKPTSAVKYGAKPTLLPNPLYTEPKTAASISVASAIILILSILLLWLHRMRIRGWVHNDKTILP